MSLRIASLASGSKGNATLVLSDSTAILVDAGVCFTRIRKELSRFGLTPSSLDGVVVTHEHSDHIAALPILGRYAPVYAHPLTARAIAERQGEVRGYREQDYETSMSSRSGSRTTRRILSATPSASLRGSRSASRRT